MSEVNVKFVSEQLKKSGISEETLQDLPQKLAEGLPEVKVSEVQVHDDIPILVEAPLKQGKKDGTYFYNGFLATAHLPFIIKHPAGLVGPFTAVGETNKIYIDTRTLETELSAMMVERYSQSQDPASQLVAPITRREGKDPVRRSITDINRDLHVLMTKEPGLFIRLMAKYEPSVDFEISETLLKRQQQVSSRQRPFQFFKTKYGINTRQAAMMLAHKAWVYLRLQHETTGEEYGAWHKINFSKLTPSGNHEYIKAHDAMKYDPAQALVKLDILEIDLPDPMARDAAITHICNQVRQGDLPIVTPRDPALEQVRLGANPPYHTLQIFSMAMRLQKHGPYLREKKVGSASTGTRSADTGGEAPEGIIPPGTPTVEQAAGTREDEEAKPEKKNAPSSSRHLRGKQHKGPGNGKDDRTRKGKGIG